MRFYGLYNPTTRTISVLTFPDGRPVPFSFRRIEGEKTLAREGRRALHNHSFRLSPSIFSEDEIKGKTDLQARASEAYELVRPLSGRTEYVVEVEDSYPLSGHPRHIAHGTMNYEWPTWMSELQTKNAVAQQATIVLAPIPTVVVSKTDTSKVDDPALKGEPVLKGASTEESKKNKEMAAKLAAISATAAMASASSASSSSSASSASSSSTSSAKSDRPSPGSGLLPAYTASTTSTAADTGSSTATATASKKATASASESTTLAPIGGPTGSITPC